MFVITADQVDSRHDIDRGGELMARLNEDFADTLLLPADQNSGDELQALVGSPAAVLAMILYIARTGQWSVGLGIGAVRLPLADATRTSSGPAFVAARRAVSRAKHAPARFALETEGLPGAFGSDPDRSILMTAADVEPMLSMLLLIRERRTESGWEAVDRTERGLNQAQIAAELGITPAAVSQRLSAALWKLEDAARPGLAKLLGQLDHSSTREAESAA
ncbi:MAG: DNA-binding protein [Microbacteriaceae bacterium]